MKEESDVAHGEPGDRADFLVAEAALESQIDGFALIAGQRVEDFENPGERVTGVVPFVEITGDGGFDAVERRAPRGPSARVERQVPADGEQPRREVVADALRLLLAQTEERVLNHVPRRFQVAQEPVRIPNQRRFVPFQRVNHPLGLRRPAHWLPD